MTSGENQLTKFQLGGKNVTDPVYICCTISIPFVHGRKKRDIWRSGKA